MAQRPANDDQERILEEIRDRLVRELSPQKIVLFGSRARGDAREDSDYDLLIVMDTDLPPGPRGRRAYLALSGLGVSADIVIYSAAELEVYSKWISNVARRAVEEGRTLFEAA